MARGRRPEPGEVKEAKGNPGRRPNATGAAVELPGLGAEAPEQLTGEARTIWGALAPELARMKLLRATDAPVFARYCDHLARFWRVKAALDGVGEVYETDSAHGRMLRINPWFAVLDRLCKRLEALEDRIGLSPAARQQLLLRMAAVPAAPLPGPLGEAAEIRAPAAPTTPIGVLSRGSGAVN